MNSLGYKYLIRDTDRHGKERIYIRLRGKAKVAVPFEIGSPEFVDFYTALTDAAPRPKRGKKPTLRAQPLLPKIRTGEYLYVVGAAGGTRHKIGVASRPRKRLATLQVGSPYKLNIKALYAFPSRIAAVDAERRMHDALEDRWATGEWFVASTSYVLKVADQIGISRGRVELGEKQNGSVQPASVIEPESVQPQK